MQDKVELISTARKQKCVHRPHYSQEGITANIREAATPEFGVAMRIPPLPCGGSRTRQNSKLVEFALADMSNTLFVSRYQVQLPEKKEIAEFVKRAVEELGARDE